ncbi:TadE/TadG family type IV pilus assembly protein [Antarctobacter jejuensis]|uniref:TadE/TadG family type IV pilus assembly protein n=1 Tax=Antarctobacter jejuensis TaxID=1439938 RepID=UPI003FD3975D
MRFASFFKGFARDTRGFVNVEAVIVFPALLFLFGVGWTYFDAFRQQAVNQKANYVISDMISRETEPLDGTYITNARSLLRTLTKTSMQESDIRITAVRYDADLGNWTLKWSEARGDYPALNEADLGTYQDRLPGGVSGEELVIVETWDQFVPIFKVGLDTFDIRTYSFTRPRYAPQLVFSGV